MIVKKYEKIAKKYHTKTQSNFYNTLLEQPSMIKILKSVKIKNRKILDVGCGSGRYTKILLRLGGKVWGIDPSERMLEIAKKENKKACFKIGKASKIPYKSNFFDIVIASLSLDHEKDIDKAFKEVRRVLREGGVFIFSRNNPITEIAEKVKLEYHIFKEYFKEGKRTKYFPSFDVNMQYYHITFQSLIKTILRNDFVIEDYIDVKPISKSKKKFPGEYHSTINKPHFCIFRLRKV